MSHQPVCVITGASAGIGKATAIEMARRGYRVVALVRPSPKADEALADIRRTVPGADVTQVGVDLSSLDSIRSAAADVEQQVDRIDVLINNAGVYRRRRELSADGVEMTFAVNALAPYALTELLLNRIADGGRIVNVTSALMRKGRVDTIPPATEGSYDAKQAYNDSKRALVIYTRDLADRVADRGITVTSVHPGVVATDVFRDYPSMFTRAVGRFLSTPEEGAEASVHLATSPEVAGASGGYFDKTTRKPLGEENEDPEVRRKVSQGLAALAGGAGEVTDEAADGG